MLSTGAWGSGASFWTSCGVSKRLEQISARDYSVGGGDRDAVGKDLGEAVGKSKPNPKTAEARSAEHEPDRARESLQAHLRYKARAKEPSTKEAAKPQ